MTSEADPAVTAVILAAGQGKRMKSHLPKVLHELCGKPMIYHVVEAALGAGCGDIVVVVGFGREAISAYLEKAFGSRVRTAVQPSQQGTGDAVRCALPLLPPDADRLLLLYGDTPLLQPDELGRLAALVRPTAASSPPSSASQQPAPGPVLAMLTVQTADPSGYGRILRDEQGRVIGIREDRDATAEERTIREVNPGIYVAQSAFLRQAIPALVPNNAQGELYLTDIVALAARAGGVLSLPASDPVSLSGINDRAQLAALEEVLYERIADRLRRAGATIRRGARIDAGVVVEADAVIEHGVVLRGATRIGAGARVDVGAVLTDVEVAASATVKPYSVCAASTIGERAHIGPFSHLRPESRIEADAHVGNFVETKKTILRRGAKANHLAYLGDGDVGERANIGAGTIFCHYDGFKKHRTDIGDEAFIGSDTQIVAPVRIGKGAYVATGTTVTRDVPEDALAISRVRQENKEGYASRLKARLSARKTTG